MRKPPHHATINPGDGRSDQARTVKDRAIQRDRSGDLIARTNSGTSAEIAGISNAIDTPRSAATTSTCQM